MLVETPIPPMPAVTLTVLFYIIYASLAGRRECESSSTRQCWEEGGREGGGQRTNLMHGRTNLCGSSVKKGLVTGCLNLTSFGLNWRDIAAKLPHPGMVRLKPDQFSLGCAASADLTSQAMVLQVTAEGVSGTVRWLASRDAADVTGHVVPVDRGFVMAGHQNPCPCPAYPEAVGY